LQVLNLLRYRELNTCRIWSPTGINTPSPHPLPATYCLYILYFYTGKEVGELNKREGKRGNNSQSWVENTNMTDCISSL
jgi:hypothetical protein